MDRQRPSPPTTQRTAQVSGGGMLPSTGADASDILLWAAIILGVGTFLFVLRLRRPVRRPVTDVPMGELPEDPGMLYLDNE